MKLKKCDSVISRVNTNNSVVLMKMDDSDVFYKINGVAARLWNYMVEDELSLDESKQKILGEYEVTENTLDNDCKKFIDDLVSKELCEVV